MTTLLNRLHSNARAKQPSNLLILNSLVKILSNYFVGRCCTIDKNVSGVSPNGKEPQVDFCPGPPNFSERPCPADFFLPMQNQKLMVSPPPPRHTLEFRPGTRSRKVNSDDLNYFTFSCF